MNRYHTLFISITLLFAVGCSTPQPADTATPAADTIQQANAQADTTTCVTAHHQGLREMGIRFVATGNEPFWSVSLTADQAIWSTPDGEQNLGTYTLNGDTAGGYTLTAGKLKLTALREKCDDSMADQRHDFTVEVQYAGTNYSGCGNFVANTDFCGKFALIGLDSDKAFLEFDQRNRRVYGNDGCNSFRGEYFQLLDNQIILGPMATTLMACPNPEVLRLTEGVVYEVYTDEQTITLTTEGQMLKFKRKID